MKKLLCAIGLLATMNACGGKSSTSPTPTPAPTAIAPATFALTGQVTSADGTAIGGAILRILDGSNAGRSATTSSLGTYSLASLNVSGFTLNASALNYVSTSEGVTLTGSQKVNFQLASVPLFSRSGTGDAVFDMPTSVARVLITGVYSGSTSNFIVRIGGQGVVSQFIGLAFGRPIFTGTYLTTGGVVEITKSSGVSWTFTERR